jgi:hypothetical protein
MPITLFSWALLKRPPVVTPLNSFPAFYGMRRFNTEFTRALHLFLSWFRPIQSTSPHVTSARSILIFTHLHLGLPSSLLPSGFPTSTYTHSYSFPVCATCPAHLILLDLIILIVMQFSPLSRLLIPLQSKYPPQYSQSIVLLLMLRPSFTPIQNHIFLFLSSTILVELCSDGKWKFLWANVHFL